jgi:hypothetical protein
MNFALKVTLLIGLLCTTQADAHHAWTSQDTRYAYYVSGVVTYVRWGNPHVEVHVLVDNSAPPADWLRRPLPDGADEQDGKDTMLSARAYNGKYKELHLTLAPPDWMRRWGFTRRIETGERIEAVGFVNVDGSEEMRPVMFWAGGQGVWQKLLPFPTRPEPAPPASN